MSDVKSYENILVRTEGRVGIVQLNRPKAMNALDTPTMLEVNEAMAAFDADDGIGCPLTLVENDTRLEMMVAWNNAKMASSTSASIPETNAPTRNADAISIRLIAIMYVAFLCQFPRLHCTITSDKLRKRIPWTKTPPAI